MEIKAYAKINITIDVGERRDDGYHEIDSIMQTVSLYDTVKLERAEKTEVICSDNSLSGENNIAGRAAELFFELSGISGGAKIHIEKNIPYPAGLGGGSADAAAVLVGLNRLYGTEIPVEILERAAVRLGADVPFFISGGTKRCEGIGERLTALPSLPKCYFVIAKNGEKSSTGEMYKRLDSTPRKRLDVSGAVEAVRLGDLDGLAQLCGNSFAGVCGLYGIDEVLSPSNPMLVSLSGSGPAVFAMYRDEAAAQYGCKLLKDANIEHWLTTTV